MLEPCQHPAKQNTRVDHMIKGMGERGKGNKRGGRERERGGTKDREGLDFAQSFVQYPAQRWSVGGACEFSVVNSCCITRFVHN